MFVRKAGSDFAETSTTRGAIEAGHVADLFYHNIWAAKEGQTPDMTLTDVIDPMMLATFARRSTFGLQILTVSLLDMDGTVLWSSSPDPILDRLDDDSYAKVLSEGTYLSELRRGEAVTDSDGLERSADLVRTLFPLRDAPFV